MKFPSLSELFSLRDQVALVTGASGELGAAMARGLALAGATIALNGRSQNKLCAVQQELDSLGAEAEIFAADLSELETLPLLVDEVIQRFGRIDILVNCIGINKREPIRDVTPETYDQIMDTNLRSVYFLSQAVSKSMIAQEGGKIIHVGSLTAAVGLMDISVYGMTKGALAQLTKTMAVEWAKHNIQVNCICPGFFATELTLPLWDSPNRSRWMLDRIPSKRPGTPDDLMGITIYLASQAANYTTGQTIYVDGGFLAGSEW